MQTLLKRWTHALLEWLGLTSATGDALDRWAAFVLVVLAVVLPVVFEEKSTGRVIVLRFMEAYIVFSVFRFVNALLYAAFHIAAARPAWQNKPIKGLRRC